MTVLKARRGLVSSAVLAWALFPGPSRAEDSTTLPESVLHLIRDANLQLSFEVENLIEARYTQLISSIRGELANRIEELEAELSETREENRQLREELTEQVNSEDSERQPPAFLGIRHCEYGAEILDVLENSPAEAAGLEPGDVVTMIDGKSVTSATFASTLSAYGAGVPVEVYIDRDGVDYVFELSLMAREEFDLLVADEFGTAEDSTSPVEDLLPCEYSEEDSEAWPSTFADEDSEDTSTTTLGFDELEDETDLTGDEPVIPAITSFDEDSSDDQTDLSLKATDEKTPDRSSSPIESAYKEIDFSFRGPGRYQMAELLEAVRDFGSSALGGSVPDRAVHGTADPLNDCDAYRKEEETSEFQVD